MEKIRTQVQLEKRQYERLKEEAYLRHQSLSQTIRIMIDRGFKASSQEKDRDIKPDLSFIGAIKDDRPDVSERHDAYLGEIFTADGEK
jgi:hypothetical protein